MKKMKRIDVHDLWGGDVFVEQSSWSSYELATFQAVAFDQKPYAVYGRNLSTGKIVKFFYKNKIYAPKLYIQTAVNKNKRNV